MNPVVALVSVITVLAGAYGILHLLGRHYQWSAELKRKSIHITLGLVCLSFPWLFEESWPVILLGGIAFLSLTLLRLLPEKANSLASGLHSVNRFSLGELFFPLVVVWTFFNSHDNLVLYLVPIAILTLADAGGALLGVKMGKSHFSTFGSKKTIEGSLTFFLIGCLCSLALLAAFTDLSFPSILLISCTLGGLATLVEGFSSHGSDNLLLPIASLLILEVFLTLPPETLAMRLLILLGLTVVLFFLRKFTSLDGGGLLSCILFGYACFALGNIWFLVTAFFLYVLHLDTTSKVTRIRSVNHHLDAVLAIASTGLVWLTLHRLEILSTPVAFSCFILAMAAHLTMMSTGTSLFLGKENPGINKAVCKGSLYLIVCSGALLARHPEIFFLDYLVVITISVAILIPTARLFSIWRGSTPDSRSIYQLKQAILALPYSTLGLLTLIVS